MPLFKKIRTYYWLIAAFGKRHYKLLLITIILATLIIILGTTLLSSSLLPKAYYRIGRVGKYSLHTLPRDIQSKISHGLVTIDASGEIHPALAKEWEISDDLKKYTFTLDPNFTWHNGAQIKPTDITLQFQEVQQEFTENEVIFHLQEPFSPLLSLLSNPLFLNDRLGLGEFQIDKLKYSTGTLSSLTISSKDEKITYKFYPTENIAHTAFMLGEIDVIQESSYIPENLLNQKNILIEDNHSNDRIAVLFFNNNDNLLSGKSARQGLAYAIENKSLDHTRVISPISSSSWAFNPNVKDYAYDPTRAKSLFSQDTEEGVSVTLELKTILPYLNEAEQIAADWERVLGIDVDVKVTSNLSDDYQVILSDYAPPLDPDQYTIWHSTQSTNFTHYQNLKVDKLLEDGRRTLDPQLRKQIYQDFQRFLVEDSPAVFLFHSTTYDISRKGLF